MAYLHIFEVNINDVPAQKDILKYLVLLRIK